MKAPFHDRLFLYRFIVCFAVFVNFLAVGKAHADLPPPTPPAAIHTIANTPHQMPLSGTFSNGRFSYSIPPSGGDSASVAARARHYQNALHGTNPDLLSGMKSHPIRLTDNYGNAARGQIRTATTMPSNDILSKAGAGLITANIVGNGLQKAAPSAGASIAQGKYVDAGATIAAEIAIAADITGLGHGINDIINAIRKNTNDRAAALQSQSQSQVTDLAGYHYLIVKSWSNLSNSNNIYYVAVPPGQIEIPEGGGSFGQNDSPPSVNILINGASYTFAVPPQSGNYVLAFYRVLLGGALTQQFYDQNRSKFIDSTRNVSMADLVMTQEEIAALLQTMLEDNRRNQTDLINALWQMGAIGPANTQTTVSGTPAENTFITPPFTPAGSDTAQQTQFIVNPDGSVTVSTINRPDLAANTSQAPTRAEVGQTAPSPAETRDAKQGSTAEKPDICAQNPNSLMCADLGSGDYTDPVIPTHVVPMDFKPADIFDTNGVCPQPIGFEVMGKTFQMSYQPVCDFSASIRPFVVLGGMILAMTLCYAAVRNM